MDPITAGIGIANTILPPLMTKITNQQNRKYALQDWERQNAYNHPKQQMQRLTEAGLNPNLVYGGGATTIAQPIKSPEMQVPNIDLQKVPEAMGAYQSIKTQQLDQQRIQKALQLADAQIKSTDATTLQTLANTDLKKLDINSKTILNQFLPEQQLASLEKIQASTNVMVSDNEMRQLMLPNQIQKVLAEIGNINARTSKVPFEKAQIQQAISNMETSRHYQQLTQSQKVETGKILQESELIKQILNRGTITKQFIETDLLRIKKQFKALGLSETVTSDLMGDIIKIMVPSTPKTTKVIHSKQ